MDIVTQSSLRQLGNNRNGLCLSLYMPMYWVGKAAQQNRIRLGNLLRKAEDALVASGVRVVEARELLRSVRELAAEALFGQDQSDGLALFVSEDTFSAFRLPYCFEELVVVNRRFYIKPLLPLAGGNEQFLVLAVSQNHVRLLEGSRWRTRVIDLAGLPKNLVEALNYDQPEGMIRYHTAKSGGTLKQDAAFHGQGGAVDDAKDDILQYFRQIDRALFKFLSGKRVPLVFAGVSYLLPIYRRANNYPHLLEQHISGNPDVWSAQDLHNRAWSIVGPSFRKVRSEAIQRYQRLQGTDRAAHQLEQIIPAAAQGLIDTLLVDCARQQWGTFRRSTGQVHLDSGPRPGNEDLFDLAIVLTLQHRGTVHPIDAEQHPGQPPLAAVFRYAMTPTEAGTAAAAKPRKARA